MLHYIIQKGTPFPYSRKNYDVTEIIHRHFPQRKYIQLIHILCIAAGKDCETLLSNCVSLDILMMKYFLQFLEEILM